MEEIKVGEYCRTDTGYIYIMKNFIKEFDYSKTKHSFNIIDLIEVGDYVNGEPVEQVTEFEIITTTEYLTNPKDIKSICTRERFESVEYKLDN